MDLSFGRRRGGQPVAPVRLDYPRLIAILAAAQGASLTARIAGRVRRDETVRSAPSGGLVAMFDRRCDWIAAAAVLEGSFNPGVARWIR